MVSARAFWRKNARSHDWQALGQLGDKSDWWHWKCCICGHATSAAFKGIRPENIEGAPDCSMHLARQIMER